MHENGSTIYAACRRSAGMTQERAAELLGVATRTLAAWETGERVPPDMRVADMVDLYGTPVLAISHLRTHSVIARAALPAVEALPLPQAVCQLCAAIREVSSMDTESRLLRIAADGRVDELEAEEYYTLLRALDPLVQAVLSLRCAENGGKPEAGA